MLLLIIFGAIFLPTIAIAMIKFTPSINGMFSRIWAEEARPPIKRETQERLNELLVDGDVPEETAVVMAATEEGMQGEELLALFNAINARDLAGMVRAKGPNKIMRVLNIIDAVSKVGMRQGRR